MSIDRKDVEYIAHLARLDLNEKEMDEIQIDLNKIVSYVDKLNELDLEEVEPLTHVVEISNRFRKDEVVQRITKEQALRSAKEADEDYFRVPKVIE